MAYIDFISSLHKKTERDYLARVNDTEYPKAKAAKLAKQWGYEYWDGDRRINYGGYRYIEGHWEIRWLHLMGQVFQDRLLPHGGATDVYGKVWKISGREEREAYEMVPVRMGE